MTNIPKKLNNNVGVKLSSTLAGQRELIREMRNKINELIDFLEAKENKSYKVASSVCCDSSFRLEGDTKEGTMFHVCNNCNKACDIKLKEKEVEASKGECKEYRLSDCIACGKQYLVPKNVMAGAFCDECRKNNPPESKGECSKCGCEYPVHKGDCPELYPPEHEEKLEELEWTHNFYEVVCRRRLNKKDVKTIEDYIRDNFVSKEKIKREIDYRLACLDMTPKLKNDYRSGAKVELEYLSESLGLGD